jgi:hypothetical protein
MSKSDIKTLRYLIEKYDIKTITITETKTIFINYEN